MHLISATIRTTKLLVTRSHLQARSASTCQVFLGLNLTRRRCGRKTIAMQDHARAKASAAQTVRRRVLASTDRLWRLDDFARLPAAAVSAELSRMARRGEVHRVAKGVYHRPGRWAMGETRPKQAHVVAKAVRVPLHPAGLTAANALGLTTQNTAMPEIALSAAKTPVALLDRAFARTRRPASRHVLRPREVALLEVLRDRAETSDLDAGETIDRLVAELGDPARFSRLAKVAADEPPRVRAMLGALGELAGAPERDLKRLRSSLNPLSRFDFGTLGVAPTAKDWQAKT